MFIFLIVTLYIVLSCIVLIWIYKKIVKGFILDIIKLYDKIVFDLLCKSNYTPKKYAKYCKLYNKKLKNDNRKSA